MNLGEYSEGQQVYLYTRLDLPKFHFQVHFSRHYATDKTVFKIARELPRLGANSSPRLRRQRQGHDPASCFLSK